LGISQRGNAYLRTLLIHGARSVLRFAATGEDKRSRWVTRLMQRRGKNVAAVALANKNARIAWALLTKGIPFQPAS
jgi:transposase